MNQPFCFICSNGVFTGQKRLLCNPCTGQLRLFRLKDNNTNLFCTTCIGKLSPFRGEGDRLDVLCGNCLARLIDMRENSIEAPIKQLTSMPLEPGPFRIVTGTIVEKCDSGYVLSVPGITSRGWFVSNDVFSIGESVEVMYLTVYQGKDIFVISAPEAVFRLTGENWFAR